MELNDEPKQVKFIESHDAAVISISFSSQIPAENNTDLDHDKDRFLLASGGRDKMIHIYDSQADYSRVSSQTHHSSTITAL